MNFKLRHYQLEQVLAIRWSGIYKETAWALSLSQPGSSRACPLVLLLDS